MSPQIAYVYKHYAASGQVLYVGMTKNMRRRQAAHAYESQWWPEVHHISVVGPFPRDLASRLEKALTQTLRPSHNLHNLNPYEYRTFTRPHLALRAEGWERECSRHELRTIQEVADRLGLPGPTYWRVQAHKVEPSARFILAALRAFPTSYFADLFEVRAA